MYDVVYYIMYVQLEIEGFLAAIHFLFTHEDLLLLMEMINGIIKTSGMLCYCIHS